MAARGTETGPAATSTPGPGGVRPGAGRKIQKTMPVLYKDGRIARPGARGSKAVQPPPAHGPITSRLPLFRGTDGLAEVATASIEEFWEKFHQYHRLRAEAEKLYLWFEEFEQTLARDNQEFDRMLSGVQSIYGPPAETTARIVARRPARARATAAEMVASCASKTETAADPR